ncbi:MAG TPA: FAD-linked oxidase C-terminal domain-containing protein [Vicinamibacterales bacterium]|nr:FAD-linked oxidase C-terminal domain-containing protein [Vicinamibacterales bacterium]
MPLERDLEAAIRGEVRFDRLSRALYATDASVYKIEPAGVVIPRSREDVVSSVLLAAKHGTSITARGGGTSQAGQAIGAGLVLDTSKHLNRILEVNAAERWARVEPGVVLDELNAHLRPHGLRFAPDLSSASRATIGGMMANNSSGARSIVYGKTIDHVLEQHVVLADGRVAHLRELLPDRLEHAQRGDTIEARAYRAIPQIAARHAGEIARRFPKVLRRVGGYNLDGFVDPSRPVNLSRIVIGSEGTLGIVVEAKIALVPLPRARVVLAVEFGSVLDALAATPAVLTHGPSAVEVMDAFILQHTREHPALDATRRTIFSDDGGALLCIEFAGDRVDDLAARLAVLERDLASRVTCRWTRAIDPAAQARIWTLREAALGLSTAMRGDAKSISFVEDTAVPPERLRDYIERFSGIVRRHGTVAGIYAHASVGCLHVRPVVNLKTAEGVQRFEAIAHEIADLVLEFGGALSGEHGDGLVRGPFTEKMFGPVLYEAFREVKRTFDPNGLFNPGKIVDSPPIASNLRFGPAYQTPDPQTWFDYAAHGGLGRAVEMCSGVGACRKTLDGTMCPSYRATREEAHSTRGRANALRQAMTGQLGEAGLGDASVYEALDLCLECRACKTECPTGVDMARFKSEFLADYWTRHGVSRRARAFGHVRRTAEWASRTAPLSNAMARSAPGRWLAEVALGVDRRRTLPSWTRDTLTRRLERRATASPSRVRPVSADTLRRGGPRPSTPGLPSKVRRSAILFRDTFTEYADPEIGVAAMELLDAAGIGARVVPHGCCGRPLISQGLLGEARALAAANTEHLYEHARRGDAILFLEPSCLSAVREDAPALLRGDAQARARAIGDATFLFEEYLEREWDAGRASVPLAPGPSSIVLHAHCHQRAMGLASAARALLSRIPGATVVELDAGCCGMAGSFGYTREHYDVSRAIGELKLLPAARALPLEGVLVAAGTSCRHQVAHFTGVRALHPAVLLRSLMEPR